MFRCDNCKKITEPRESPVLVVGQTREVDYHNEFERWDEDKNLPIKCSTDSSGWEIVKEFKFCPDCGVTVGVDKAKPVSQKPNYTFEEKLPAPLKAAFVYLTGHATLRRLDHKTQRAKRDYEASIPLLKHFLDENKEYAF